MAGHDIAFNMVKIPTAVTQLEATASHLHLHTKYIVPRTAPERKWRFNLEQKVTSRTAQVHGSQ